MRIEPSGEECLHWGLAIGIATVLVAATIIVTILSFAAVGSVYILGGYAIYAGLSSRSIEEFEGYGEGALVSICVGGVLGAAAGYSSYQ